MEGFVFCARGFFHAHFHVLLMHIGSTKMEVNAKLVQEFSANYHVVLIKHVSHMCAIANCGHWIKFGHFETHVTLPLEETFPATQLKLIFLHAFFLRCCNACVVIKAELVPEPNNVFKVVCVSFSCFAFNSTKVIAIKVTGSIFCLLCGWIFGKYVY